MVYGRHGVEQVGGVPGARLEGGFGRLVVRIGMADGYDHTGGAGGGDEFQRPVQFGGQCDQPQRAPGPGQQIVQFGPGRGAQSARELRPGPGPGYPRALEVGPEYARPRGPATAATPSSAVLSASGLSDTVVASSAVVP